MSFISLSGPRLTTRRLTMAAMLTALEVILNKLSIGDPAVVKIGLGFIGTALIGYCLGPWLGGGVMVINDIISNTIFNTGTAFFPGFTFSAFIAGMLAGMILYRQQLSWQRAFIYELVQIFVINVCLTTLWIYMMSLGSGGSRTFWALLLLRLPKEIISWPIESLIVYWILNALSKTPLMKQL